MPAAKKTSAVPANKKMLDAKQKKLTTMEKSEYQKGLKAGSKAGKMPNASAKTPFQESRAKGYSTGVISAKQDIAKFKRNQAKKK